MILVTGASGTVGSEVVKALQRAKAKFKVADRAPGKSKVAGVEAVLFDYQNPATFAPALAGVEKIFLLSPNGRTDLEAGVVDAAKKAGIKHIVKLSVYDADGEQFIFARGHRAAEKYIEASGVPYTFLRPNGFMQNYATSFGATIKSQGAFYLPMADARVSTIDVRDIAAVAAAALTDPGHENTIYTLTGPEALTNAEIAQKISAAIGKTVKYVPVPDNDAAKGMKTSGLPEPAVNAIIDLMHYYVAGKAARVTNDVERVAGKKPITFDQFAKDYKSSFA
jgi:uncharacterized protein YbjT (DUF2867 family)